jgi:MFS family permease
VDALEELRRGWRTVAGALLGIAFGVTGLFFYSSGVFLKPLSSEFGWSRTALSSVSLIAALALASTAPVVGWLVDRLGVRAIVLISSVGLAAGFTVLSRTGDSFSAYLALIAATVVLGAGASPVVFTRLVNLQFDKARGTALGLSQMATGIAGALIPPLLTPYVAQSGWRAGYEVLAVTAVLSAPFVLLLIGAGSRHVPTPGVPAPETAGVTLAQAVRSPIFSRLAIMFFAAAIAVGGVIVHLVSMLTDAGLSPARAGAVAGFLGMAIIVGRAVTGIVVDRVFAPRVAFAIFLLSALGCWLLAWGGIAWAPVASILVGLAMGAEVDLISYLVARYFGMVAYGRIYGWLYAVFLIGTALGPLIAGACFDRYGDYVVALTMLGLALAIAASTSWTLGAFPSLIKKVTP